MNQPRILLSLSFACYPSGRTLVSLKFVDCPKLQGKATYSSLALALQLTSGCNSFPSAVNQQVETERERTETASNNVTSRERPLQLPSGYDEVCVLRRIWTEMRQMGS